MTEAVPWSVAMARALTGDGGFYRRHGPPAAHFRTSATAAPGLLADVLADIAVEIDARSVLDLGAGGGELLAALAERLDGRVALVGVDVGPRPPTLPSRVRWASRPAPTTAGLVVAHEYLDDVPVDVVEVDEVGTPRQVLVDPATGEERLGPPPSAEDRGWLERWWHLPAEVGARAEVGRHRDAAWAGLVSRLTEGVAVAVDYDHRLGARPRHGTLLGYRSGRAVRPVPDGRADITAHVALDACAEAGRRAGATTSTLLRQSDVLRAYGLTGARPPLGRARTDPAAYLRALVAAGLAAELLDPAGLGGFGWLVQAVGGSLPARLARLPGELG